MIKYQYINPKGCERLKKALSIFLIFAILVSFTSCSKIKKLISGDVSQDFSYPVGDMPSSIDPQVADDEASLIIIENCMEGLVRADSSGKIIPGIAQSWDISSDGTKYTFHLRSDAEWLLTSSNEDVAGKDFNTAITADDFVFGIERAVAKQTGAPDFQSVSAIKNASRINSSGTSDMSGLGVRAENPHTLVIELENKDDGFLSTLTAAVFMPCSKTFFNKCSGRYGRQSQYFLNNAGFKLYSWGESDIVLNKNEDYKGANSAKGSSVTLYYDENAFADFEKGNYDAIALNSDKTDYALSDKSFSIQKYDDTVWVLAINCAGTYGSNSAFRKSLMMSFSTDKLYAPDWAEKASGLVPNICTAGGTNYRSATGKAQFISYNPEKGKEKYLKAVESISSSENTQSTESSITFCCTEEFDNTAKYIIQDWQQNIGTSFDAKIKTMSLSDLESALKAGNYDVALFPVSANTADALVFLKTFVSSANVMGYSDSAVKSELLSSESELTKCRRAEKLLINSAAVRPLFTSNSYYVKRNTVQGIYFYAFGGRVNFMNAVRVK